MTKENISAVAPKEVADKIKAKAKKERRSKSQVIIHLLEKALGIRDEATKER